MGNILGDSYLWFLGKVPKNYIFLEPEEQLLWHGIIWFLNIWISPKTCPWFNLIRRQLGLCFYDAFCDFVDFFGLKYKKKSFGDLIYKSYLNYSQQKSKIMTICILKNVT